MLNIHAKKKDKVIFFSLPFRTIGFSLAAKIFLIDSYFLTDKSRQSMDKAIKIIFKSIESINLDSLLVKIKKSLKN